MTPVRFSSDGTDPMRCIECGLTGTECKSGIIFAARIKGRRALLCSECVFMLVETVARDVDRELGKRAMS